MARQRTLTRRKPGSRLSAQILSGMFHQGFTMPACASKASSSGARLRPMRLVAEIEGGGGGKSKHCADLVRFMAYGGFRKTEAANVVGADCDFERGTIMLRGHPETGLKNRRPGEVRQVPMIQEMREFLRLLQQERGEKWATSCVNRAVLPRSKTTTMLVALGALRNALARKADDHENEARWRWNCHLPRSCSRGL